ncbi:MAG: hypothetical protein ACLFM0_08745 [Spirochaetales bacterium]
MVSHRISKVDNLVPIRSGIVTVSDKSGLEPFVSKLADLCAELALYSTGGTYRTLSGIPGLEGCVHEVSEYTGQPETQGGLVKTLDYRIYLGVLGERYNEAHVEDRRRTGSLLFDLVVVNLYPFADTVARGDTDVEAARSNIDIGGPTLIRAAAKNFPRVAVVCDPADYEPVIDELASSGGALSLDTRFGLAQKAFGHVAEYDRAIDEYLSGVSREQVDAVYGGV